MIEYKKNRRRGSALLESSLVLLVFLATLLGTIDFGQILFFHLMLADRVRAGARFAVVSAYDPASITNVVVYNSVTAPSVSNTTGLFGLTASMVNVTRYNAGTNTDRVEVSISNFPIAFYSPWISGSLSPRTFRAVMPIESLGATQ